jgi:hypothetical protein
VLVVIIRRPVVRDGVAYWKCSRCKKDLPADDFYRDKRQTGGLKSQCKKCHTAGNLATRDPDNARRLSVESRRRDRARRPEHYRAKALEEQRAPATRPKVLARRKLQYAVRRGRLVRPDNCARCGGHGPIEAHHADYSRPLDVEWLCRACHGRSGQRDDVHCSEAA